MIETHASFTYNCDLCQGEVPDSDSTYSLGIGGITVDICPVCQMKPIRDLIKHAAKEREARFNRMDREIEKLAKE